MIIKLQKIINKDRDGNDVKDVNGNVSYIRHDGIAFSQLINAVDSKIVAVSEYIDLLGLDDKSRDAAMKDLTEVELTVGEAALLKKLLNNPQNDKVSYPIFFIRTIHGLLEQLK